MKSGGLTVFAGQVPTAAVSNIMLDKFLVCLLLTEIWVNSLQSIVNSP